MNWTRVLTLCVAIVGTATFLHAQQPGSEHSQSQPTFKQHRIGESAQEFFAIAQMAGRNGMLSNDYCHSYLSDPKVKKAIEKSKRKSGENQSLLMATMDVDGCNNIQAALAGQDAAIELRFAAEFGDGKAQFVAGHLALLDFVVRAPFNDVVEDVVAKLNANPQLSVGNVQNNVAGIFKQRRANWKLPNLAVTASELQSLEGEIVGTEVIVSNPEITKHRSNVLN